MSLWHDTAARTYPTQDELIAEYKRIGNVLIDIVSKNDGTILPGRALKKAHKRLKQVDEAMFRSCLWMLLDQQRLVLTPALHLSLPVSVPVVQRKSENVKESLDSEADIGYDLLDNNWYSSPPRFESNRHDEYY